MFIFNYLSLIKCAAAHYCPKIMIIVISIIAILLIVISQADLDAQNPRDIDEFEDPK
jgi:hypothetical protein